MTRSDDDPHPIDVVGIVGAGIMGTGIAQVALEAGREVVLHDVDPTATDRARESVRSGLARRAARLASDDAIDAAAAWVATRIERLRDVPTLDAVAAEADLIVEAALEDLELKRTIIAALDSAAPPDVLLGTNTSALSIGAIAEAATHPERVVGLHFFNPVPLMDLVEVVAGTVTSTTTVERAWREMVAWGKTPVRSADRPGFIVNRVNRPFTIEALRILEAGAATVIEIDDAMRAAGFPMGPFELMDLAGLDVNLAAARGVWDGLGRPNHLRPSPIQERLVAEGRLGRKTGVGFYHYEGSQRAEPATDDDHAASDPEPRLTPAEIQSRILGAVDAEAQQALAEGVATADDIDLAMRAGARHPSGPFERAAARPVVPTIRI